MGKNELSLLHFLSYRDSPRRDYPYLATLMDGWFNQDYELFGGPTYQGVIADLLESATAEQRGKTIGDIERFLDNFGTTNKEVVEAMVRVFYPCFLVEGWDGLTTREWLKDVAPLIEAG